MLCPLCGKNASLRHLNPESFDVDILAQDVVGLGPGQGFKTTGRHSILHSAEVETKVLPRLFVLVKLMIDEGIVSADQVRKRLGLPTADVVVELESDEAQALREEREELEESLERIVANLAENLGENSDDLEGDIVNKLDYVAGRMADELGAATDSDVQSAAERVDSIMEEVANALGQSAADFVPEGDEGDSPVSRLIHFVRLMLDEFTALKENQEGGW